MKAVEKLRATRAEKAVWAMNRAMVSEYLVTMASEVDATGLERLRARARATGREAPSFTAIVIKAVALLMREHPQANRAILGPPGFRSLFQLRGQDVCAAVEKSLPYLPGLAMPGMVRQAADQPLLGITHVLRSFAQRGESEWPELARFMRILRRVPRPLSNWLINLPYHWPSLWPKYRGCAAWVNAPSKAGADLVMTAWPWPLNFSFGVVKPRPFVVDSEVRAVPTIPLVLVFDRRIMGGGPASRLFARFQDIIANADEVFGDEFPSQAGSGGAAEADGKQAGVTLPGDVVDA